MALSGTERKVSTNIYHQCCWPWVFGVLLYNKFFPQLALTNSTDWHFFWLSISLGVYPPFKASVGGPINVACLIFLFFGNGIIKSSNCFIHHFLFFPSQLAKTWHIGWPQVCRFDLTIAFWYLSAGFKFGGYVGGLFPSKKFLSDTGRPICSLVVFFLVMFVKYVINFCGLFYSFQNRSALSYYDKALLFLKIKSTVISHLYYFLLL